MINKSYYISHKQRFYNFNLHNINYLRINILIISCDVGVTVQKYMGVITELSAKH